MSPLQIDVESWLDHAARFGRPWSEPVVFDLIGGASPFPVSALPQPVAAMVAATAEATQAAPGLAGVLALAVLSASVGGRVEVWIRSGAWREPLNLYVACVARPGESKSPTLRHLAEPLREVERENANLLREAVAAERARREVDLHALRAAERSLAKADDEAQEELRDRVEELAARSITPVPELPRLLAGGDATPEALARIMAVSGGRTAVLSDEGGLFDRLAGLYSNRVANVDLALQAWAGDEVRVERVTADPIWLRRPILTLGLCLQPVVVEQVKANPALAGRGLPARFLFACPESRLGQRTYDATGIALDVAQAWGALVRELASPYLTAGPLAERIIPTNPTVADRRQELDRQREADRARPASLMLDAAGDAAFRDFFERNELRLGPDGDLADISGWGAKLPGQVLRLAGLLHLADRDQDRAEPLTRPIGAAIIEAAVALGDYFAQHAQRVFGTGDEETARARRALRRIVAVLAPQRRGEFSAAEAWQMCRRRNSFPDQHELDRALTTLEKMGWIRHGPAPPRSRQGGRSPSARFEVHPRALVELGMPRNQEAVAGIEAKEAIRVSRNEGDETSGKPLTNRPLTSEEGPANAHPGGEGDQR